MSWPDRLARLARLLNSDGDDDKDGAALDRLLHGQSVIGPTPRTKELDALRFSEADLAVIGALECGQYGTIHLVTCKLDNKVYVRKSISKKFALRTRDQCSPILERTLLLLAHRTQTPWAPPLLCAFQSPSHLHLVMRFAPGGSLRDLLESSARPGGRVGEGDVRWWAPQVVAAVGWCHAQGYAHRDVKPNNFVLTESNHVQLIDFGSAAPLLEDGRAIAREYCLVPCGTCDYISPEILHAHERALVRLELDLSAADDDASAAPPPSLLNDEEGEGEGEGYGAETDWWSAGAMLYEMVYGNTPFFAESVKTTYLRIMDYETSLRFDKGVQVSEALKDLLRSFLTDANHRLGRQGLTDVQNHPFFASTNWAHLHSLPAPPDLHTPQFTALDPATAPSAVEPTLPLDDSAPSLAWSAVFQQSSPLGLGLGSFSQNTPRLATLLRTPRAARHESSSVGGEGDASMGMSAFIGFSWGPPRDLELAAPPLAASTNNSLADTSAADATAPEQAVHATPRAQPRPIQVLATPLGPRLPSAAFPPGSARVQQRLVTPSRPGQAPYMTPARPMPMTPGNQGGLGVGSSATGGRRGVSEREALRQLMDCVGMSARKAVLASGRKPRVLLRPTEHGRSREGAGRERERERARSRSRSVSMSTLEFAESLTQSLPRARRPAAPGANGANGAGSSARKELRFADALGGDTSTPHLGDASGLTSRNSLGYVSDPAPALSISVSAPSATDEGETEEEDTETEASAPPSPSPSPRPGSALALARSGNRRSLTPTASLSMFGGLLRGERRRSESPAVREAAAEARVGGGGFGAFGAPAGESSPRMVGRAEGQRVRRRSGGGVEDAAPMAGSSRSPLLEDDARGGDARLSRRALFEDGLRRTASPEGGLPTSRSAPAVGLSRRAASPGARSKARADAPEERAVDPPRRAASPPTRREARQTGKRAPADPPQRTSSPVLRASRSSRGSAHERRSSGPAEEPQQATAPPDPPRWGSSPVARQGRSSRGNTHEKRSSGPVKEPHRITPPDERPPDLPRQVSPVPLQGRLSRASTHERRSSGPVEDPPPTAREQRRQPAEPVEVPQPKLPARIPDAARAEPVVERQYLRVPDARAARRQTASVWDDMEERHARLMRELDALQHRLDRVRCA